VLTAFETILSNPDTYNIPSGTIVAAFEPPSDITVFQGGTVSDFTQTVKQILAVSLPSTESNIPSGYEQCYTIDINTLNYNSTDAFLFPSLNRILKLVDGTNALVAYLTSTSGHETFVSYTRPYTVTELYGNPSYNVPLDGTYRVGLKTLRIVFNANNGSSILPTLQSTSRQYRHHHHCRRHKPDPIYRAVSKILEKFRNDFYSRK
jgi:hypothetical protein